MSPRARVCLTIYSYKVNKHSFVYKITNFKEWVKTYLVMFQLPTGTLGILKQRQPTRVYGILVVTPEFVEKQLDCIFNDIYPDAIKIGMVASIDLIKVIARKLIQYDAKNIVIDPVMFSTSGYGLMDDNAMTALISELLPLGDIITSNIDEVEYLSGLKISSTVDMILAS